MTPELLSQRFPRSHTYNFEWIREGGMGSHPLWLAEWLSESLVACSPTADQML